MDDLFNAIENFDENKVREILKRGQNPNIKGFAGITPLHLAVDVAIQDAICQFDLTKIITKPKIEIIKLLLEYGAKIYEKDERGSTALDWANEMNFEEAIELMNNFSLTKNTK